MRIVACTLLFLGFAVAGCSADEAQIPGPGLLECSVDGDCDVDRTCHRGQCLSRTPVSLSGVDVEITPPDGSDLARHQILGQQLDTSVEKTWVVPTPVRFGTVQVVDGRDPIAARVSFRGRDRIPTREVDTQVLLDSNRSTGIALMPGTYDVRVLPTEADRLPGVEIRGVDVLKGSSAALRELATPSQYRLISGDVSRRTMSSLKLAGVTIAARSIGAGLPSTRAVTQADGRYQILLPDTPDTSFVLTATPPEGEGLAWSFTQTVTLLGERARSLPIPLEETTDAVRGTLRLRVLGHGAQGPEPIGGAHVVLTATTGLDYRTLTVEGVTDAQGFLSALDGPRDLAVLAARYRVLVEPPVASPWQARELRLDLSVLNGNIALDKQIELMPKTEVTGSVASSLGQAVADARVTFERTDGNPRGAAVTTASDGRYRVLLEAGAYVVTVTPTPNSKVAEALPVGFAALTVGEGTTAFEAAPIALGAGSVLRARVQDANGTPIPRAVVELFIRLEGARSIGRVIADDEGKVALIVPAS